MKCVLASPHQWKTRAQPYCQCDISLRDRTEHAENILSQHTDKVMSHILTTALGTSPTHCRCSVLLYSTFTVPHLFQPGDWDASNNTASLKWLCQAHDGRKQLHPSNLLPATCAHRVVSQSSAIPSRIPKTASRACSNTTLACMPTSLMNQSWGIQNCRQWVFWENA